MMKRIFLIILYCLSQIILPTTAQNISHVDSLTNVLQNHDISQRERADIYVRLAGLYSGDPEANVLYTDSAISLARAIDYREAEVDAYINRASHFFQRNQIEQIDSLYKLASELSDSLSYEEGKIEALISTGVLKHITNDFEESITMLNKALEANKNLQKPDIIVDCYKFLGANYYKLAKYDLAIEAYLTSLSVNENQQDVYTSLGASYAAQGNYVKSLDYYITSLKIAEKVKDTLGIITNYQNMGVTTLEQDPKDSTALPYLIKALQFAEYSKNSYKLLELNSAIGTYYTVNQPDFAKAEKFLLAALTTSVELDDSYNEIRILNGLSDLYIQQNNTVKAQQFLERGIKLGRKNGYNQDLTMALDRLGTVYYMRKNFVQAKRYFTESLLLAEEIDAPVLRMSVHLNLSKLDSATRNYKSAYEHLKKYEELNTERFDTEKSKQLSSLKLQFETEKKEQEIESLNQQNRIQALELTQQEEESKFNLLLFAGITAALLLSIVIYYLYNQRKKLLLTQQAQQIEQKLLRSQMNPHFMFNALNAIQEYVMTADPKKAYGYLTKFSRLMRQVLEHSRTDYISLEEEINMLENYLNLQNVRQAKPFQYQIQLAEDIDPENCLIPPMFAQPFIENAIEHGLATLNDREGMIQIAFSKVGQQIHLIVQDNGVGIGSANTHHHQSLATQITKERIHLLNQSLKSTITFQVEALKPGTLVRFQLPYKESY